MSNDIKAAVEAAYREAYAEAYDKGASAGHPQGRHCANVEGDWLGSDARAALAPSSAPEQATQPEPVADSVDAVLWFMSNGWRVWHSPPASFLTDEANREHAWHCERTESPFCTNKPPSDRRWFGPTPSEALRRSIEDLGKENPELRAHLTRMAATQAPHPRRAPDIKDADPKWVDPPCLFADDDTQAPQDASPQASQYAVKVAEARPLPVGGVFDAYDLIERFGRGVTDVFEQMQKGSWIDDHGHRVEMNKAMLDLLPVVQAAIDFRATPQASSAAQSKDGES